MFHAVQNNISGVSSHSQSSRRTSELQSKEKSQELGGTEPNKHEKTELLP